MPIGSTVAEVVTDSTLAAHLSLAHLAVVRCAVAAQQPTLELRTRQDGRTVSRVGLHYWSTDKVG
eukprot:2104379-Prymnesium_polylepis.1